MQIAQLFVLLQLVLLTDAVLSGGKVSHVRVFCQNSSFDLICIRAQSEFSMSEKTSEKGDLGAHKLDIETVEVRRSGRMAILSEKGFQLRVNDFQFEVNRWGKKVASTVRVVEQPLESLSIPFLDQTKVQLDALFDRISTLYEEIHLHVGAENSVEYTDKYDEVTVEHANLLSKLNASILELDSHVEQESVRSEHSRISAVSRLSKKSLMAEKAAAETKLKFIEKEASIKKELEHLLAVKELEVAKAKIKAFDDEEVRSASIAPDGKSQFVKEFIRNVQINPSQNVEPKVHPTLNETLDVHARPFMPQRESSVDAQRQMSREIDSEEYIRSSPEIVTVMKQLSRPRLEVSKFDGNPLAFRQFMRQFNSRIVTNTFSDEERLAYLEQLTTGDVQKIVRSYCQLPVASEAYNAVLRELERRFGDEDVIASAYVKKVLEWPKITDVGTGLDPYAIFLTECGNAVQSIDAMKVLEYPENMKRIIAKLPLFLHDRWRSVVENCTNHGERPNFMKLVAFIDKEARKVMHPIYGKDAILQTFDDKVRKVVKPQKARSLAGVAKPNDTQPSSGQGSDRFCCFCESKTHDVGFCNSFKTKDHKDKVKFVKDKGLCFGCLKHGHMKRSCTGQLTCKVCQKGHPTILHIVFEKSSGQNAKENMAEKDSAESPAIKSHVGLEEANCTFAIVPVRVRLANKVQEVKTYAFLDPGSNAVFCAQSLINKLCGKVIGKPMNVTVDTLGVPHHLSTRKVKGLEISDLDGKHTVGLPYVYTKEKIPASREHVPNNADLAKWEHLSDVELPEIDGEVELLIGNNIPDAYIPLEIRTGPSNSPYATRTRLGWVVWSLMRDGQEEQLLLNRAELSAVQCLEEIRKLEVLVQQGTKLDFPEKTIAEKKEPSVEDKIFLSKVNRSIQLEKGHYEIGLPFRDDQVQFPDNRVLVEQRLMGLKKRFVKNETLHSDYTTFMETIIEKGYAEKVPESEIERKDGKVWYIPHHSVYHPKKPSKIRVVFDCAASYMGTSLNKVLLQGPDLTNSLIEVLLEFRQETVAIKSDIESMFYQVLVKPDDTDCLRFLWWPTGDIHLKPVVYRMKVHLFGAVSSPSCANVALRKTVEDNQDQFEPEVGNTVLKHFYVDDMLKSIDKVEEAVSLQKNVSLLCEMGGFHLTKWSSNNRDFLQEIPVNERATSLREIALEADLPPDRALGVEWNVEDDVFKFSVCPVESPTATRRNILSIVSKLFDPLGFVSPFVLQAKILLHEICRQGLQWDDEVPDKLMVQWHKWLDDLQQLSKYVVPRCIKPPDFGEVVSSQIHLFADASENGYGIAAYLRLVNAYGKVHCSLLLGRARVNPLKKVTIPRLELTAATLAVKIHENILKNIYPDHKTFFWTDSMSVLRYLWNTSTRFQTFVANRVSLIQEATSHDQWRHVPSECNPADLASRGLSAGQLINSKVWISGPEFLWTDECNWPQTPSAMPIENGDPEVKKNQLVQLKSNMAIGGEAFGLNKLLGHYSSWYRLKRAVAWMLMIKDHLRSKVTLRKNLHTHEKAVDVNQLQWALDVTKIADAEKSILRFIQASSFPNETNGKIGKDSSLRKLNPMTDDHGLLRVGGRLHESSLNFDAKHPIVLPNCFVAELILRDIHQTVGHLGRGAILAQARQKYWIMSASVLARRMVKNCVVCRKYQARAMEQKMADLPVDRTVASEAPFTRVGVDYFGPFEIKRGRSMVKRYGVVFTCLAIRAIHIEMASSLDTSSCIDALRRFIARRGPVKIIWSDNGTNLVGAEKELRSEFENINKNAIKEEMLSRNIDWHFNPPTASHFGGVWERMIRTIRKVLHSLLKGCPKSLDDEALMTLFCEVEKIINDRPLTKVSSDPNDLGVLTPSQLLLLKSDCFPSPCGQLCKEDMYLRKRWKQVQFIADAFWERWSKEYIVILQERQKWLKPKRNVQINDVVLVMDSSPRSAWAMGKVVEVEKDKHGLVRVAKVKTKSSVLCRPVHKLCMVLEN